MKERRIKLIIILGPTASGKSALAVRLARRFNGEIISADSRQIYRGLDIGTGKITRRQMQGIRHHCLDMVSPKRNFSVSQFAQKAGLAIQRIASRGKLPILTGGTGLYIDAVARGMVFPEVPPNLKLRKGLSQKSTAELFSMLKRLDPERAAAIDPQNPRRLIRALEIIEALKKPVPALKRESPYDALFIGIERSPAQLRRRIRRAVAMWLKRGLLRETAGLLKRGIPAKRLMELGIGYNFAIPALKGRLTRRELAKKCEEADWNYAKRQKTWFRRYRDIHWVRSERQAARLVKTFLRRSNTSRQRKNPTIDAGVS